MGSDGAAIVRKQGRKAAAPAASSILTGRRLALTERAQVARIPTQIANSLLALRHRADARRTSARFAVRLIVAQLHGPTVSVLPTPNSEEPKKWAFCSENLRFTVKGGDKVFSCLRAAPQREALPGPPAAARESRPCARRNIRPQQLNGANRRIAAVRDRVRGRLNWAESAPTGVASGRTGVRRHSRHSLASAKGFTVHAKFDLRQSNGPNRGVKY